MTEQEVSVRLTENDERLYACAKRLEAVERRQDALDKLVTAVEVLAVRQESVEGNVKEIRNAVQSITEKPGKRWEALALPAARRGILPAGTGGGGMRRKWTFSKLLLLLESAVVLYTTYEGFALARLAVGYGYLGTLPWVAATVSAAWGAYGASAGFYYNKAKAENTAGGIVFESACGRQARSGQDCDGWEENG